MPGAGEQTLNVVDVDHSCRRQSVTTISSPHCILAERSTEPMNVALQSLSRCGRWPIPPQHIDQHIVGHASTARCHQPRQHPPFLRAEPDDVVAVNDLDGPQDPHLHDARS
jgi:hypothetical protein